MFPSRDHVATNGIAGKNRFKHETDQLGFDTTRNLASEGIRQRKKYQEIDIDAGIFKKFNPIPGFKYCWLSGHIELLLRHVGAIFLVAFFFVGLHLNQQASNCWNLMFR